MLIRTRIIAVTLLAFLLATGITGCGSNATKAPKNESETKKSTAQSGQTNGLEKKKVLAFAHAVLPLLDEADKIHRETKSYVQKFGYSEISAAQTLQKVLDIHKETEQIKSKLATIPAEGELEVIQGELATSLYLKQQNLTKLETVLRQPNPKGSELNKILAELQGSEGFLEKSKGRLNQLEQSVGIQE